MAYADAGLRATSFAAAAALLGLITVLALTMPFTMARFEAPTGPLPVVVIRPVTEPHPPPEPARTPDRVPENETPFIAGTMPSNPDLPPVADEMPNYGPREPMMISDPRWVRRPNNLERYYPRRALQAGVEGDVVLDCRVSVLGMLECSVVSETPPHWGFGDAAERIARDHEMAPAQRDGVAVDGRYRMRVPFRLD